MGSLHVTVLNLSAVSCKGNCKQIPDLIPHFFPREQVELTVSESVPVKGAMEDPDLVVVCLLSTTLNRGLLLSLRRRWPNAVLMGVFCASYESPAQQASYIENLDDFLSCPFKEKDLALYIQRVANSHTGRCGDSQGQQDLLGIDYLVGESAAFQSALRQVYPAARYEANVLITGETGTGKELFARAIHQNSKRRNRPFIAVNCGALPETLVENELFGHVRGAYTDASGTEQGLLAAAEGGTLFLDEIDGLGLGGQGKLLRFLQDREYRRLGSSQSILADVRIISACNVNLRQRIRERRFREDLYYRLNVLSVDVPPLRERMTDIPLLARHLLAKYETQFAITPGVLSHTAIRKLSSYSWPGNVRELEGVIQRTLARSPAPFIQAIDIQLPAPFAGEESSGLPGLETRKVALGRAEKCYLLEILAETAGNISHAAKAAKMDRRTFQRLLHKHGLNRTLIAC